MIHDHRRCGGALARAILTLGLVLCFSCGAATCAAAHGRAPVHAARAHYHHHWRTHRHHHWRRHRVTFEQFERGLAAAKPIIGLGGLAEDSISVGGHEVDRPASGVGFFADLGNTVGNGFDDTRDVVETGSTYAGSTFSMVAGFARELAVPVSLAMAVNEQEGASCTKIGRRGEHGPMQVLPATARAMGLHPRTCAEWAYAGVLYLKLAGSMHGWGCGGASAYQNGVYTPYNLCTVYGRSVLTIERRASRRLANVPDRHTAVYDIATHTVYLPDGRRLEAHSGRGSGLDNARYAAVRRGGPTPPGIYELCRRAGLFHGIPALRLIPISATTYGRAGLLVHPFMLGPRGESLGCVSLRDYAVFLRAYESGEVRRLKVVGGIGRI